MRASRLMAYAAVAALACGCMREEQAIAESSLAPKRVRCIAVQGAVLKETIEVRGTVAPLLDHDAQVAPQVVGRLLSVDVHEGDSVTAGAVIARVDQAPLVDAAQQADAALMRARAEHQNAETTLARVERVFEHGIVARQEVDDAAAHEAAAKAAVVEAESAARQAHRQTERAAVRSPLAGVVLKVLRKPGELVDGTPATPVAEIANVSDLELVADVPAQDLVRLLPRAPASVEFPALPGSTFTGVVSRVAPAVDRTTGFGSVRVALDTSDHSTPPVGIFGTARVESGKSHPALLVPPAAIRALVGSEGEVVECGEDRRAHVHKVRVGESQAELVAVDGKLTTQARVAVEPLIGLAEGDPLEVLQ